MRPAVILIESWKSVAIVIQSRPRDLVDDLGDANQTFEINKAGERGSRLEVDALELSTVETSRMDRAGWRLLSTPFAPPHAWTRDEFISDNLKLEELPGKCPMRMIGHKETLHRSCKLAILKQTLQQHGPRALS